MHSADLAVDDLGVAIGHVVKVDVLTEEAAVVELPHLLDKEFFAVWA